MNSVGADILMFFIKVTVGYDTNMTGPRSLISFIQEVGAASAHYRASLYIPERRDKTEKDHEI